VQDDGTQVKALTPVPNATGPTPNADDLEMAKAQLGLDSDILQDAQDQLAHATGDQRAQIQQELTTHEAAVAKYDEQALHNAQLATVTVQQYSNPRRPHPGLDGAAQPLQAAAAGKTTRTV